MIDDYIADTGDKNWTKMKVAAWGIRNGKWEQHQESAIKELARDISRVAGKATFVDKETGQTVRKYHAWRLGEDQPMFWSAIDSIAVENMRYSINARRDKSVDGLVKATVDARYFNKHHNPSDPIQVETDLTQDVSEKLMPTLYDDKPPADEAGH